MTFDFYYVTVDEKIELERILKVECRNHFGEDFELKPVTHFRLPGDNMEGILDYFSIVVPNDVYFKDLQDAKKSVYEQNRMNGWKSIREDGPPPTISFHEEDNTKYLVKMINEGTIAIATGTQISVDMAGGCFVKCWKYLETDEVLLQDFISDVEENLSFVPKMDVL